MPQRLHDILLMLPNPSFRLTDDAHEFHELIMPVRGRYAFVDRGVRTEVTVGQGVYFAPGFIHRGDYPRDGSVAFLLLQWYDDKLDLTAQVFDDQNGHLIGALQWLWECKDPADLDPSTASAVMGEVVTCDSCAARG